MIIYLNNESECGGATAVIPRQGPEDPAYNIGPISKMPGFGSLPWINDRNQAESYLESHAPDIAQFRQEHLYPRERKVAYEFGNILFYRHDTWHRGTPLSPNSLRLVCNLTFSHKDSFHVNILHIGWSWAMYEKDMMLERLIAKLSVEQRNVLGFPPPGHRYWNEFTLAGVAARYECFGMNMTPYRLAVSST